MKQVPWIVLAFTLGAGAAAADHIGVYPDEFASEACLNVPGPFPRTLDAYVVHRFTAGSIGLSFRVVDDNTGMVPVSQTLSGPQYVSSGSWDTGWVICYGSCYAGDVPVAKLTFSVPGAPPTCSSLMIVANPDVTQGTPVAIDCADEENVATAGRLTLNSDESCACIITARGVRETPRHGPVALYASACTPNPVRSGTWGRVKALYR